MPRPWRLLATGSGALVGRWLGMVRGRNRPSGERCILIRVESRHDHPPQNLLHRDGKFMQTQSNSNQWTVDVDVAWVWTKVGPQSWRVLAEVEAVALTLAWAQAKAEAETEAWAKLQQWEAEKLARQAKLRIISQSVSEGAEQAKAKAKAQASAWALELAEVHRAMRAWMHTPGQRQVQTWLRMSTPGVCKVEVERDLWPRHRNDYWWLIQIITPIARLPPELLQHIILIYPHRQ